MASAGCRGGRRAILRAPGPAPDAAPDPPAPLLLLLFSTVPHSQIPRDPETNRLPAPVDSGRTGNCRAAATNRDPDGFLLFPPPPPPLTPGSVDVSPAARSIKTAGELFTASTRRYAFSLVFRCSEERFRRSLPAARMAFPSSRAHASTNRATNGPGFEFALVVY